MKQVGKKAVRAVFCFFCLTAVAGAEDLALVGTGDGLEMFRAMAVEYAATHPRQTVAVPASIGSSGGILAVGSGKERMGRIARPLKPRETEFGLEDVPIARIMSAIFANPSAGITEISAEDLVGIYSGRIRNWAELGGADLRIRIVRREEGDSTMQALRASMPGWADLVITEKSKTAVTTQEAVRTVISVPGAIGYGPYSRILDLEVSVLKVDGRFPTDPDYPTSVRLSLIYKKNALDGAMKSFLDFALSEQAAKVIGTYGGVPVRE